MEPCPHCNCEHIGTDVIYAQGAAMFCQSCQVRGPRAPIDMDDELWLSVCEAEAKARWNEWARAQTTTWRPYLAAGIADGRQEAGREAA